MKSFAFSAGATLDVSQFAHTSPATYFWRKHMKSFAVRIGAALIQSHYA